MNPLAAIIAVSVLLASSSAWASGTKLVELAVFSCPYCRALQSYTLPLRRQLGDDFIFAPVAEAEGEAWTTRAYYALRDTQNQHKLANALFALVQSMRMTPKSSTDVLQWLQFKGFRFDDRQAQQAITSQAVNAAMQRARRLASLAGVRYVPAMVLIHNGEVIGMWQKQDNQSDRDFINTVLDAWEKSSEYD